MKTKDTEVIGR